jgi:hypothetical protein
VTDPNPNSREPSAGAANSARTGSIPPRQHPHELAFELGFESLVSSRPSEETLHALGAVRQAELIRLPALNRQLLVDTGAREVNVEHAGPARRAWAILALHHLCAADVSPDARQVSLGHFPDCRGYLDVFAKRIIGRFLGTAGRTAEEFAQRSEQLGATRVPSTGLCYRFDVFPRLPIMIVRYEGDDELGPGAGVIYRADAEHLLPAEDRVVAAELLLDALAGKSIEQDPGASDEGRH